MCVPVAFEILGAEPAKDRIYDSPYFIPVYLILALTIWVGEQLKIRRRRRKTDPNIKDE